VSRRLRIGVTIGLGSPDESLWINGIKQNALNLAAAFMNSPQRHEVTLINTTATPITAALPWDLDRFPTRPFAEAKDNLDVLIELGGQIGAAQTSYLKERGVRLVSYCCGPEYIQASEAMIFGRRLWDSVFLNTRFDQLWVIPQVAETSLGYFETFRRRPARVVPFVWDPMCLETVASVLPDGGTYRPKEPAKRLTVLEPNYDVLKFCLYPIFIAERAWRRTPERIGFLHVCNAEPLVREAPEFVGLMRELDIVRDRRASFVGAYMTPWFLAEHTDVVISHQWGLPLNYMYLEACWQGYPLVHNAKLCADLGYYYPANDLAAATDALVRVLETHDDQWTDYRLVQRNRIARFLASDPALIADYDALLDDLMAAEPAP